jgi:hypothetical protein
MDAHVHDMSKLDATLATPRFTAESCVLRLRAPRRTCRVLLTVARPLTSIRR